MPGEQDFIAKFIELFETWPDAVFIVSPDGSVVACNVSAQKLSGLGRGDLFAMPVCDIFRDELLSRSLNELSSSEGSGEISVKSLCTVKGGGTVPVLLDLRKFFSNDSAYILLSVRNLSEIEESREEVRQLKSQLRHSRKLEMVGRLTGGIIHYYNNIFTGLIGALDVAQREASETVLPLMKRAKRAANTASGYTKRLLAFTRDEQETVQPTDIGALLVDIRDFAGMTFDKHITVNISSDNDLRAVIADPADLHHMLLNLIVNARDAVMEKMDRLSGEGKAEVSVKASNIHIDQAASARNEDARPGDHILLKVSDSGIGMDELTRQRIFDPYFTTKDSGKGTGIGLAAVFETVTGTGGWIEIDSEPGRGTVFSIYLPSVMLKKDVAIARDDSELPTGSETVLIVDDDDMIRTLGEMTLERQGYSVIATATAAECLNAFMRHRDSVDLLLLDLSLPDRPGEKLLEDIRRIKADINVIVTSGRDFEHDNGAFDILRADEYLTKPFTIGDLAVSVRNTLDSVRDM